MIVLQIILCLIVCSAVIMHTVGNKEFEVLGVAVAKCEQAGEHIQYSNGLPIFHSNEYQEIDVFGLNLTSDMHVGFSREKSCNDVSPIFVHVEENTNNHVAFVKFTTPNPSNGFFSKTRYYICFLEKGTEWKPLDYQYLGFYVDKVLITPEILLVILILVYALSSLMSGLNIGLLSLDTHELELLKEAGSPKEKKYSTKILPVRRCGNFLLSSILITATLCNAVSTVTVNHFVSDWIAVVITTIAIVLLCEILPQSICTAYPLFVGAKTIYVTMACMVMTAPVAYPLGKVLDWLFGKESLLVTYNKERLQELLTLTQLETHEAKIIAGTLSLSNKTVEDVMTNLKDMFKLPITAVLDYETIAKILDSGFSRIPIYVNSDSNIQYILLTKDLALLDPEDKVPVKILVQNEKLKCHYVSKGTTVDKLLETFKDSRNHMVFVVDDPSSRETLPQATTSRDVEKNVIGLVTFEDVIEEILQMEINDETDNFSDNRNRNRIKTLASETDLAKLLKQPSKAAKPSANMRLAIFNFLSEIDVFSNDHISPKVLKALLNLDIYFTVMGQQLPQDMLFVEGVPGDYFVMILEGEVEVKIGSEGLVFEAGAFRYFGIEALKLKDSSETFIPDYTVQAVKRTTFMRIDKVVYEAAVLATQYEISKKPPDITVNSDLYKYYQQLID